MTVHAVLRKRDVRAIISWVGISWAVPVIGPLAYLVLGVNRIQRKAIAAKVKSAWRHRREPRITPEDEAKRDRIIAEFPTMPGLAELGKNITSYPLLPGNCVEPLLNGDEAFPEMLAAIESATESVSLLSYIFDSDRAGDAFLAALATAAKKDHVKVRVLVDHVGARYSKPNMVPRLREAGVNARTYRVMRLRYANLRNHRKILVVDGKTGFTGGTNIREGHWLSLNPREPVRCMHFKVEGPVVGDLQEMFAIDWAFATGESLEDEPWFPDIDRCGTVVARGIPDGPDEDLDKLEQVMLGALASATQRVCIVTPYFLPNQTLVGALTTTAMRGVRVDIVLPEKNNLAIMNWATRPQLPYLIDKGCNIHFSPPPFDHTKLLVVDGLWSLIGSTNWDARSLRLNFEYNIECYDLELARQLEARVDAKIAASRAVTSGEIADRHILLRFRDGLARLLSPYL